MMYCDSAYINTIKNNVEAFGNVRIIQPDGTEVMSDYLRYTGNSRQAYLKGNVSLTDGKDNLWAEELEYNLSTKIGVYHQGGTLQSEATTLSSNTGQYNVKTKDARFKGDVLVSDPEYDVSSTDLGYNTETKVVRFFGPSVVTNERSRLKTSSGTWDAKSEIAHFTSRSSIRNEAQFIEGDKLDYNKKTGEGNALGNVIAIDTNQNITLYSGRAVYNEITQVLWADLNPVLKKVNRQDSIFIRADTFYAAPVPEQKDSFRVADTAQKSVGVKTYLPHDTLAADSSRPRYFIGFHHVLVYSDSLQAVCDSIVYSQKDSAMRLIYQPVAWSRNSQITGDTIVLFTDTSSIKRLWVPNNALVVSQSGPEKANMFDQVQGKTLTGFFENNNIEKMIVWPAAEAIYYSKDDEDAYLGMVQASSERMTVFFENQQISRILLEQGIKQKMTPMQQVNPAAARLSRFQWWKEKRPKSVEELFLFGKDKPVPLEEKIKEEQKPAGKKQRGRRSKE